MAEIITLNPVSVYWACHKNSEVFSGKLTSCVILNSQGYVKKNTHNYHWVLKLHFSSILARAMRNVINAGCVFQKVGFKCVLYY